MKEVIAQFRNENIEKKQLGKRGLHLNGFGLEKFTQNLIAGIRELWTVESILWWYLSKNESVKRM